MDSCLLAAKPHRMSKRTEDCYIAGRQLLCLNALVLSCVVIPGHLTVIRLDLGCLKLSGSAGVA